VASAAPCYLATTTSSSLHGLEPGQGRILGGLNAVWWLSVVDILMPCLERRNKNHRNRRNHMNEGTRNEKTEEINTMCVWNVGMGSIQIRVTKE
jgi:hypothetical protein